MDKDFNLDSTRTSFTGGVYLNKVIPKMEIDLGARLFMPMTAKASFINAGVATDNASVTVKSAGGVNVGLGFKYVLPVLEEKAITITFSASALHLGRSTTYTISGLFGTTAFNNEAKVTEPVQSAISLGASMKLSDKSNLSLDFGISMQGETKISATVDGVPQINVNGGQKDSFIQYGVGVTAQTKPVSALTLKAGINLKTPEMWTSSWNYGIGGDIGKAPKIGTRYYITVPLSVSYSF